MPEYAPAIDRPELYIELLLTAGGMPKTLSERD
jgi:hypothetical protein